MNIWVKLFGDDGVSDYFKLSKTITHETKFEKDQVRFFSLNSSFKFISNFNSLKYEKVDVFVIDLVDDLGTLYAIEIKYQKIFDDSPDLHLNKVQVQDEKFSYEFFLNDFLTINDQNKRYERMILLERTAEF